MGGIAGWLDYDINISEKEEILTKMGNTLQKRGAIKRNQYITNKLGLIESYSTNISKDELTRYKSGEIETVIAYDGKIYNNKELQDELKENGYNFFSNTDEELILKVFDFWKEDGFKKLNGVFAFAIWILNENKILFVRDHVGAKPIFYYPYYGGVIFGSEIKTLLANPMVMSRIDNEGLKEILLIGPGRTLGNGVIKGVKEVMPGEIVTFDKSGLNSYIYWKLMAKEHTDSFEKTVEKTKFLIEDSVKKQVDTDENLCCMLSGGLDSSIITKLTKEYYKKGLFTYSVDYVDNDKYFKSSKFQPNSDNEFIKIMQEDVHSYHKKIIIKNEDLYEALEDATEARDLPGMADIDSSILLFGKEIKKDFDIALSGECADEIFAGYPWYHDKEKLYENTFPWSRTLDLRKQIFKEGFLKNSDEYVQDKYDNTISRTSKLSDDSKLDARMREMFMLNFEWFMQTLVDRNDRMNMYNGLEVRTPFCDYRIVEYAYNMPWKYKAYRGREKGIVREAVQEILPHDIAWRKKSPYPKTHNPVYFKLVSKNIRKILKDKHSFLAQTVNKDSIEEIIKHPDQISIPWYGQLMRAPQMLAYLIQIEYWVRKNNITII